MAEAECRRSALPDVVGPGKRRRRGTALLLLLALASWPSGADAQDRNPFRAGIVSDTALETEGGTFDEFKILEEAETAEPVPPRLTIGPEVVEEEQEVPEKRLKRGEPDLFEPLGLRAGGFLVFPVLELGGVVTDNVRQSKSNRRSDIGLRVVPDLRVESDWVRHSFRATVEGEQIFYADEKDFNQTELDAATRLRLDVLRSTTFEFTTEYSLTQTPPSDVEVPDAAVGMRLDHEVSVEAALTHRFNRLEAELRSGATWLIYGDVKLAGGGVEDNSDSDYVEPLTALRLSYETSPSIIPFIEVAYAPRFHRHDVDSSGLRRDSHGGFLLAGAEIDISEIWSGEVALRVDLRDYQDPTLDTIVLVGVDSNVTWRPTRLTTVRIEADTGLNESTLEGVGAIKTYDAELAVAHALRENVELRAGFGFGFNDYPGSTLDEFVYDVSADLAYVIHRNVELVFGYDFTLLDTKDPGRGYHENRVHAGVRFRL